jgi:hypothetical protein
MTRNTPDAISDRTFERAARFWEAREVLTLLAIAGNATMVWLPWITGRPTLTVLGLPFAFALIARARLKPEQPPLPL